MRFPPYTPITSEPEAQWRDFWDGTDKLFIEKSNIAIGGGATTYVIVVEIDTRTDLQNYDLVITRMGGELLRSADVENEDDLTWRLTIDSSADNMQPAWSGPWASVDDPWEVLIRVPKDSVVRLECAATAQFSASVVHGVLMGKAILSGHEGPISTGAFRS